MKFGNVGVVKLKVVILFVLWNFIYEIKIIFFVVRSRMDYSKVEEIKIWVEYKIKFIWKVIVRNMI